jgi:hypothetical protein
MRRQKSFQPIELDAQHHLGYGRRREVGQISRADSYFICEHVRSFGANELTRTEGIVRAYSQI